MKQVATWIAWFRTTWPAQALGNAVIAISVAVAVFQFVTLVGSSILGRISVWAVGVVFWPYFLILSNTTGDGGILRAGIGVFLMFGGAIGVLLSGLPALFLGRWGQIGIALPLLALATVGSVYLLSVLPNRPSLTLAIGLSCGIVSAGFLNTLLSPAWPLLLAVIGVWYAIAVTPVGSGSVFYVPKNSQDHSG
ncbi:hypothetical protein [Halorientalis salina]|uniref:hypothetical protein n=1 Tax=Halorientalis salina TaxID=2932266 RepID=UPI0010AD700F|nr:hypothetical protein [Halorientalis salina]